MTIAALPADGRAHARALAARITVPAHLPPRADGTPLEHLSASSYNLFIRCPEAWRRRYLLGERTPVTPAMHLGSCVDDTVSHYYRQLIAGHPIPTIGELRDIYAHARDDRRQHEHITFTDAEPADLVDQLAVQAIVLFCERIAPTITDPVAVQRKLDFKLSPDATWSIVGYIDLEERHRLHDLKIKASTISPADAHADMQASTYCAARWLEGQPVDPTDGFTFDVVLKPGARRKTMTAAQVHTGRNAGQIHATLVRYAAAARQIVALHAAFGAHQPWAFADPKHHLCAPHWCALWISCPAGGGLDDDRGPGSDRAAAVPAATPDVALPAAA